MAKKTRTQLSADASNVNILDNTSQQVTPAKVRNQYTDERDSVINYVDDFTGSVGDLLTIGTDGESITWIPVSDVQTPPGGSTGDLQINAGGGNFGATTDIVITSGNVSIPNGDLSVDGNLSLESSLPILSLRDSDTINSAGRIDFKDGTNTVKAQIGYNATDGFDFTTTSSFTFDGGNATFSGNVTTGGNITLDKTSANNAELFLLNNGVGYDAIYFGDNVDNAEAFIRYDASNPKLEFRGGNTGGANLTIEDGGNATFSGDVTVDNGSTGTLLSVAGDGTNDGSAYPEIRVFSTRNGSYTGTGVIMARLGFESNETSGSGAGIHSAIDMVSGGSTGSHAGLSFKVRDTDGTKEALYLRGNDQEAQFAGSATFSGDVTVESNTINLGATSNNIANINAFAGRGGTNNGVLQLGAYNNVSSVDVQIGEIDFLTSSTSTTYGQFRVRTTGSGGLTTALAIDEEQNISFTQYGSGNKTGTATYALGVDASGNVVETSALVAGNAWTPTFSALSSNLTSVTCPGGNTAFYQRVGNIVSFSMNVNITYSSSGSHFFDVSLPVSSNFTDSSSVAGVASSAFNNTNFSGGGVTCDATNALQVNLQTTGSGTTIAGIMLSGHYEIK